MDYREKTEEQKRLILKQRQRISDYKEEFGQHLRELTAKSFLAYSWDIQCRLIAEYVRHNNQNHVDDILPWPDWIKQRLVLPSQEDFVLWVKSEKGAEIKMYPKYSSRQEDNYYFAEHEY